MLKKLFLAIFMNMIAFQIDAQLLKDKEAVIVYENSKKILLDENNSEIKYIEFIEEEYTNDHSDWLRKIHSAPEGVSFKLKREIKDQIGQIHFRYDQYFKNIKIEGAQFIIHSRDGKIFSANGEFIRPGNSKDNSILISEEDAFSIAKNSLVSKQYEWDYKNKEKPKGEKSYFAVNGKLILAYKFDIYSIIPLSRNWVFVNAKTGKIIAKHDRIHEISTDGTAQCKYHGTQTIKTDSLSPTNFRLIDAGRNITTKDMNTGTSYFSAVHFTDTDNNWTTTTSQDDAALDAHYGAEMTFDFFFLNFSLNSYNDLGASINSFVHYNNNYVNAFWDGTQMTYGDGDGVDYSALTSIDVVAHEITHAVTEHSAGLIYSYESGALNESFSDIFGVTIDYYADPINANWYMGDLFHITGNGFRDMANPNSKNDPDTYLGSYWHTSSSDNGGVHTNSGVQNFWYYLLVNGGSGTNDLANAYNVSAIGMDDAASIAYRNLSVYLTSNSQYSDARFYAIQSAVDLFGACSTQEIATTNAWYAVGIGSFYANSVSSSFTISQNYFCNIPATVTFSNTSLNDSTRIWNFGDGTFSSVFSPTHTYTNVGTYTVTLITTGNSICGSFSDTLVMTNLITVTNTGGPISPTCTPASNVGFSYYGIFNFTFNTINNSTAGAIQGYQDYTCSQSTTVTEGDFVNLNITTGNSISEYVKVYIDYNNDGNFSTVEEVYSDYGFQNHNSSILIPQVSSNNTLLRIRVISDRFSISSTCYDSNNSQIEDYSLTILNNTSPPIADFIANITTVNSGSTINYTSLASGFPSSYSWSFPGGSPSTSTVANPIVTYNTVGVYDAQLVATNGFGADTELKTNYVTVTNQINMCSGPSSTTALNGLLYDNGGLSGNYSNSQNCYFLIQPACADSIILSFAQFQLESGYDYLRIYDGINTSAPLIVSLSGSSLPSDIVATSGSMYIYFHTDGSIVYPGFAASWSTMQTSSTPPITDFSMSNLNPPLATPVQFTDLTTNTPVLWAWDFGDGNISSSQNPTHSFMNSGVFNIQLIASTCGFSDTIVKTLIVQSAPILTVNPISISQTFNSCNDSITIPVTIYNSGVGDLYIDTVLNGVNVEDSLYSIQYYTSSGANTSHLFSGLSTGLDTVHLTINMQGDFDNSSEFGRLIIDGIDLGIIPDFNQTNVSYLYDLYGAQLATFLADGVLNIVIDNSTQVDVFGTSYHEVIVEYGSGSDFIDVVSSSSVITQGDSLVFYVTISTNDLIAGTYVDSIAIYSNNLISNPFFIPVTLINNGIANLNVNANCLLFDTLLQYTADSMLLEISNNGCNVLTINSITNSTGSFSFSNVATTIEPNETDSIWVTFSASALGIHLDTLVINTNANDTIICLSGHIEGAPNMVVEPDPLVFNVNCGDSLTLPINIYNTGLGNLEYSIDSISINTGNTLEVLALIAGVDYTQEYQNTINSINQYFTNYNLTELNTTSATVLQSSLIGKDILLIPEIENGNVSYFSSYTSVLNSFVTNGGTVIYCASFSSNSGAIFNAGLFSGNLITNIATGTLNIVDTNDPLAELLTTPFSALNATGSFNITNPDAVHVINDVNSNSVVCYREIGAGKAILIGFDYYSMSNNSSRLIANAFNFAGSSIFPNWVTNITPNSDTIQSSDSSLVYITVSADGLLAGTYDDFIIINNNSPSNPQYQLSIQLIVNGTPEMTFSDNCFNFDTIIQNNNDTVGLWIYNTGCDTLNITNIVSSDTEIGLETTSLTIQPYDSIYFNAYFNPTLMQPYSGSITFYSNSGDSTLCFTGISLGAPIIEVVPDSLYLNINACQDSVTIPFYIVNSGLSDLDYSIQNNFGVDYDEIDSVIYTTSGATTTHLFSGINSSVDTLFVQVTINGDYDSYAEYTSLTIDGNYQFQVIDDNYSNGTDMTYTYAFTSTTLANWLLDNQIIVSLTNSSGVGTSLGGTNKHTVRVYTNAINWITNVSPLSGTISPVDSTEIIVSIDYSNMDAGQYSSQLIINSTDPLNSQIIIPVTINVGTNPCSDFVYDIPSLCSGQVNFTDNTTNTPTSWNWDFGDGNTSLQQNPSHLYATVGTFTVQLMSCNGSICDTTSQNILISSINGPIAAVCIPQATNSYSGYGLTNVSFAGINNTSTNTVGYEDFTCSNGANLVEGTQYTINLTSGNTTSKKIRAWIDLNNDGVFSSSELLLDLNSVFPHTGNILIPGGAVLNTALRMRIVSTYYSNPDPMPCTNVNYGEFEDYTVTIIANTNPPIVDFVADNTTVGIGQTVNFTDLSINIPTAWSWTFNGATSNNSTMQNPSVSYSALGVYPVKLVASNSFGVDSLTKLIYINVVDVFNMCTGIDSTNSNSGTLFDSGGSSGNYGNFENCSFLINPLCALDVTLSFTSFYSPTSSDFMRVYDGIDASGILIGNYGYMTAPPSSITASSGSMFITWYSNSSSFYSGWEANWTSTVPATAPIANFSVGNLNPPLNVPLQFTDLSTNLVSSWFWNFGDGSSSIDQNPIHQFTTPGIKIVQLVVYNCFTFDTVSITLNIQDSAIINTFPNPIIDSVDCGGTVTTYLNINNSGNGDLVYDLEGALSNLTSTLEVLVLTKGVDMSGEYINTINSIDQFFTNYNLTAVNTDQLSVLQANLIGKNVVLIPEIETGSLAYYSTFATELQNFTSNGGTVIFCGRNNSDHPMFSTGLFSGNFVGGFSFGMMNILLPNHYLLDSVATPINGLSLSGYFNLTDVNVEKVLDFNSNTVVASREIGSGRAILIGYDFYTFNLKFARILSNAVQSASINGLSNWVNLSMSADTVLANDTSVIAVTLDATNLYAGTYYDTIVINSNDLTNSPIFVPVEFIVNGQASINVNPTVFNFGVLQEGSTAIDTLYIENLGCDTLDVTSFLATNTSFTVSPSSINIAPFSMDTVYITFMPDTIQVYNDTIFINNNDSLAYVLVNGEGIGAPIINVNPNPIIDDIYTCNTSFTYPIDIYNSGSGVLNWNSTSGVVLVDDFELGMSTTLWDNFQGANTSGSCGTNTGSAALYFSGTSRFINTVSINSNSGGTVDFYLKYGKGSSPCENLDSGDEVTLEYSINGGASWIVINTYSNTLYSNFTLIQESIPALAQTSNTIFRWNQANFSGSSYDNWAIDDVAINTVLSAPISPNMGTINTNDTTTVYLTLTSADFVGGVYTSSFTINSNDPLNPIISIPVHLTLHTNSELLVSQTCIDFGTIQQNVTSTNSSLVILNIGCANMLITSVTTTNSDMTASTGALIVASGSSTNLIVDFLPTTVGLILDSITIHTDGGDTTICVTANIVGAAEIVLSPISSYSSASACESINDETFYIHNIGIDDLIWSYTQPSVDFPLLSPSAGAVLPGDSVLVTLSYTNPATVGLHTYLIPIASNDPSNAIEYHNSFLQITSVPCVNFDYQILSNCDGVVAFNDLTIGTVSSFLWNFGDGNNSTIANPTHSYASSGTFPVELIVCDLGVCDTLLQNIIVTIGSNVITASCYPVCLNPTANYGILNVNLNTLNNASSNAIEGYQDFSCSLGTNLIVNDLATLTISTHPNTQSVKAWIDYNNDGIFAGNELILNSYSQLSHIGQFTPPANAVLNTPVRMRVKSDISTNTGSPCDAPLNGQAEDYYVILEPNLQPMANFDFNIASNCSGMVSFNDNSSNNTISWLWNFGDGNSSTLQNPSHQYFSTGVYSVMLTATNSYGTDILTQNVTIEIFNVDFSYTGLLNTGQNIFFNPTNSNAISWSWDFADGNTSNIQNPSNIFNTAGQYIIILNAQNANGCSSKYIDTLNISLDIAIKDIDKSLSSIYPNPNDGNFIFEYKGNSKNINLVIYNNLGQAIFNQNYKVVNNLTIQINKGDLSKGAYYIKMNDEKKSEIFKFIIK